MTRIRRGPVASTLAEDAESSRSERTLLVIDRAVVENPAIASLLTRHRAVVIDVAQLQDASIDLVVTGILRSNPDRIVGIGGGRLHDATALARLAASSPGVLRRIDALVSENGALVAPPATGSPRLALVPTTIGPGSETSSAACRERGGRRSVLVGGAFRADLAVLDPALTATLSAESVREGVAEAALRLLGSRGGSPADPTADARSRALLRILAQAGAALAEDPDQAPPAGLRAAVAAAGAATHTVHSATTRPFAATQWYLANELSTITGLRKVPATLPLLPELWRASADGVRRAEVWSWFAAPIGLDPDPVVGVRQWSARWSIAVPAVSDADLGAAAAAVERRWGGRHPALPGLQRSEALRIFRAAFGPADRHPDRASRPHSTVREGVNT